MTERLKKACRECPYRRDSAPGYLGAGSGDPMGFIAPHWHGTAHHPCHMRVNWELKDQGAVDEAVENAPTCFGFATMCKNSAKMPLNRHDAEVVREAEADRDQYFSHLGEFAEHHQL